MFKSLLHISINGPPVKKSEAVINKAVMLWKVKKHRRKLPRSSRLQHKGQAVPSSQEEHEVEEVEEREEERRGDAQEEEIQELPSQVLGQEEEFELAKELDVSYSSEDSAFESDMEV